jgi:hypothetical protein
MFLHRICRPAVLVASTRPIAAYSVSDGAMVRPCFELGNAWVKVHVLVTVLFVVCCLLCSKAFACLGRVGMLLCTRHGPMSFWIRRAKIR